MIPMVCIVVLIGVQYKYDNSAQYKEYIEYSKSRTEVEDFTTYRWEDVEDKINSVTESQYNAVLAWKLFDTERINTNIFKEISKVASTNMYPYSFKGVVGAIKEMAYNYLIKFYSWIWTLSGIIFILLLFLGLNIKNNRMACVEAGLSILGAFLIIFYFTIRGRAIIQIWTSVVLSEEFLTATLTIRKLEGTDDKKYKKIFIVRIILIGLAGSCLNHANIRWHIPQFAINSRSVNCKDKFCETYKDDSIYIWGGIGIRMCLWYIWCKGNYHHESLGTIICPLEIGCMDKNILMITWKN